MARYVPYHATNEPGTCLWCGQPLRRDKYWDNKLGHEGDGIFCRTRCGYDFGRRAAELGYRFESKPDGPERPKRRPTIRKPKCPKCGGTMTIQMDNEHAICFTAGRDCPDTGELIPCHVEGTRWVLNPRRTCHYCETVTHHGREQPFTDGVDRFVCRQCIEREKIAVAQEQDEERL